MTVSRTKLIVVITLVVLIPLAILGLFKLFNRKNETNTKYRCTGTTGVCVADQNGTFDSRGECEAACKSLPVPPAFSCTDNVPVADRYGMYPTMAEAAKNCNLPPKRIGLQKIPDSVGYVVISALPTYTMTPTTPDTIGSNCDIPTGNAAKNNGLSIFNDHCYQTPDPVKIWTNTVDVTAFQNGSLKCHGTASIHWEQKSFNLKYSDKIVPAKGIFDPAKKFYLYAPYYELNKIQNPVSYYLSNLVGIKSANTYPVELWVSPNGPPQSLADWGTLAQTKLPPQQCTTDDGLKTVTLQGGDSAYRGLYWIFEKVDEDTLSLTPSDFMFTFDRGLCPDEAATILVGYRPFGQDVNGAAATRGQSRSMIVYPDPADDPSAIANVSALMTDFVTKLFTDEPSTSEPSRAALAMIDYTTWAKYFILNEMLSSVDGFMYNSFLLAIQDPISKKYTLKMGPVWDMHLSSGSCSTYFTCRDGGNFAFWRYAKQWLHPLFGPDKVRYGLPQIFARLLMSRDFSGFLSTTYSSLRKKELSTQNIMSIIDQFANVVTPKINGHYTRWPRRTIGASSYTIPFNMTSSGRDYTAFIVSDPNSQVNQLKQWYVNRLAFLDANMVAGPAISPATGNNQTGLGIVLANFVPTPLPPGVKSRDTYDGNCSTSPSGGCDLQSTKGFFYAKFPSTNPNVFKDFP